MPFEVYGPKAKIATLVVIFFCAVVIIAKSPLFSSVRITVLDKGGFFLTAAKKASSFTRGLLPFSSYRDRIAALDARAALLSQEVTTLKALEEENARLRGLLFFKRRIPFTTIPAQVVARDFSNWSHSVIIDKGSADGIHPHMAVMTARGLVGRVTEAGAHTSKVLLITDFDSKVGAILERTRQGGMVVGTPGGTCRMIYISPDADVAAGEHVFTAGYGAVFPKGILIGTVTASGREAGRMYTSATVRPSQDLSRIEEVLCIR